MSDNPLEQIQGIAGEHFENYVVIVVHPEHHELEYVYDNVFACKGMLDVVKEQLNQTELLDAAEIDWEDAWNEEMDDEDSDF